MFRQHRRKKNPKIPQNPLSKSSMTDVSLNIKEMISLLRKREDFATWGNPAGISPRVLYQQYMHVKAASLSLLSHYS